MIDSLAFHVSQPSITTDAVGDALAKRVTPLPWPPDLCESLRGDAISWCRHWQDERLAHECVVRWSSRMIRSLGRAYGSRGLIRMNAALANSDCEVLLREVLCHELAHIAVHRRFGSLTRPHCASWRHCLRSVGLEPRVTIPVESLPPSLQDFLNAQRRPMRRKRRRARRAVVRSPLRWIASLWPL